MDMFREFFKIGADISLFDGLEISREKELCNKYLGKFPVISISLKDVGGLSYKDALTRMSRIIKREARKHQYLLQSSKLSDIDKEELKNLFNGSLPEDIQEESLYSTVKEWYDGYRFGKIDVYCPWDVINYVSEHLEDREAAAKMYWINTSGNSIVKNLVKRADSMMRDEIEQLIDGGSINKEIKTELTYKDLDNPEDLRTDINKNNLWSILFTTGYLTMKRQPEDARNYELVIPNKEIHNIFVSQIKEWME